MAIITALGLTAVAVVGNYEGIRLKAYKDVVGVWTACYGETKGIKPGMKFTKKECDIMFIEGLARHETGMRKCLKRPDDLSDKTYVAALSLTYNIGIGGFCHSRVARNFNANRPHAACDAFLSWNKGGGRVIKALVTRRNQERKLCIDGLDDPVIKQPSPAEHVDTP